MNNYLLPLLGDCGGQVIWAILLTHPQPLPKGGGQKGSPIGLISPMILIRPISPMVLLPPLGELRGHPASHHLAIGGGRKGHTNTIKPKE